MDEKKPNITRHITDMDQTKQNKTMQHCHRKTNKNKIWKWVRRNWIHMMGELIHTDHSWRQELWLKEDNEKNPGNIKPTSIDNTHNG